MSHRTARRLAWGLVALTLTLMVSSTVIYAAGGSGVSLSFFMWAIALVFAGVGAMIATRHPENAIGWIFLSVAVTAGLAEVAHAYADYWVGGNGGSEALAKTAAWYASLSWIPFILVPATFLLLLFPDGHLLSPRWRPVAWCAALGIAGGFVTQGMVPGPLEDYPQLMNPYGVSSSLVEALSGLSFVPIIVGIGGSAASLIVRFRRATGDQRLQMKWLALAGAILAVIFPLAIVLWDVWGEAASNAAIMASVLLLPIAAGVAILRYRLYDIDVVINRTLVYGALTVILAGTYLGSVLLLQPLLNGLTGDSGLAVAASTLAVAAVFRPARARIQGVVDRRFYRRKYDAGRTLTAFSARLRDEVDLEALSAELSAVVDDAMQPSHVSLWLRVPESQ